MFFTMLCEELRVSTLLKDLISRHAQKKKKKITVYRAKINTVYQSRMHSETAQQNTLFPLLNLEEPTVQH